MLKVRKSERSAKQTISIINNLKSEIIMATKHLFLNDLHFSFKLWANEISFFNQEIGLFEGYLADVAQRWTDKEVMSELEHFQNQFIIQREQAEILAHDIKLFLQGMAEYAKENETAIDHKHFDAKSEEMGKMADRVDTYKSIYAELKSDFRTFLSKYM
jgi:hypothetical protein